MRLRGCTGWCAPLLFETPKTWFLALMHDMHLVARNPTLLHANNKGAVQPAHPHNVISALDGVPVHVIAKLLHAQRIQNRAYREHGESFFNI